MSEKGFMREIKTVGDALAWFEDPTKKGSKYRQQIIGIGVSAISTTVSNTRIDSFVGREYHNIKCDDAPISQDWFEPDSSPCAWTHFATHYTGDEFSKKKADLRRLYWGRTSKSKTSYYQLHAISDPKKTPRNYKYNASSNKPKVSFRGDCDFNFNEKKYPVFVKFLCKEIPTNVEIKLLAECYTMHHSLLNFSLMQAEGRMQQFKGSGGDRLDRFVYHLNEYYTHKDDRKNSAIVMRATEANRPVLMHYLNQFDNIDDYCAKIYFLPTEEYYTSMMEDEKVFKTIAPLLKEEGSDWHILLKRNATLIADLIASGDKPLSVVEYMLLAVRFWQAKETYFELIDKVLEEAKKQQ